jgi:hypothetical protein
MKRPISADHRLAVALRYFAGGDMYKSMYYSWSIAPNTISLIVKEVAEAIVAEFGEEHLAPPTTPDEWKKVANKFQTRWNFPHVLGAIDGKHVEIEKPKNSGSKYFNYKKFFSIIMLALVDADYKFLWVNAGVNGACSDAQIWNDCDLHDLFKFGIGIPPEEPLDEEEDFELPYYVIGDDAFGLRTYLMKPYGHRTLTKEERIFNYRLSRARRIVENAFGILTQRFRCLLGPMRQAPETVTTIVLACCILHNMLRSQDTVASRVTDREDAQHNVIEGTWRRTAAMTDSEVIADLNRATNEAKAQRDWLKEYVNSDRGAVPWQERMVDPHYQRP